MAEQPNFGPYSKWDALAAFSEISEKAFCVFDQSVNANWAKMSTATHHLFVRMAYTAKVTSTAIRLNNSWALVLPALALTRVRLEQTIVCSFILHEDPEKGLDPFVRYVPIALHRGAEAAMEVPGIAEQLKVDLKKVEADAAVAQAELTPGFTLEDGEFQRNWTALDLRSMAKRRDSLASVVPKRLHQRSLEPDYLSIYKMASAVVHADCMSYSFHFLNVFASPGGTPVLMALPPWALMVAAFTAHYDVLQCFEILRFMRFPEVDAYHGLFADWKKASTAHV